MKPFFLSCLLALVVIAPATAGTNTIELEPAKGATLKCWGMAAVTSTGMKESFKLRVDADMKDGTQVVIAAEIRDEKAGTRWVDVAKVELQLGTASLFLSNKEDVSAIFPVSKILRVAVKYRDRAFLEGDFLPSF